MEQVRHLRNVFTKCTNTILITGDENELEKAVDTAIYILSIFKDSFNEERIEKEKEQ